MINLIKTYDDILDSQTCKNVIDKFEQFETQHESFDVRGMVFTQLNMAKSPQIWSKEIEQFTEIFQNGFTTYLTDTGEDLILTTGRGNRFSLNEMLFMAAPMGKAVSIPRALGQKLISLL